MTTPTLTPILWDNPSWHIWRPSEESLRNAEAIKRDDIETDEEFAREYSRFEFCVEVSRIAERELRRLHGS